MSPDGTAQQPDADDGPLDLSDVFRRSVECTDGDEATLGELLGSFDGRSYGPLLFLPSLVAASPLGAIPGMSIVTGALIFLIAVQMLFLRECPWLPRRLRDVSLPRDKLERAVDRIVPWTDKIDKVLRPRWSVLVEPPADRLLAAVCCVLAISFYPLAIVPFGVALPAGACLMFSAALTARDGLLAAIGLLCTAGSVWLGFWLFSW